VTAYCLLGKGCRRQALLAHFGESRLPLAAGAHCCDLCSAPAACAEAAARLSLVRLGGGGGGGGGGGSQQGGASRKRRSRNDPHGTGLVEESESDEEAARSPSSSSGGPCPAGHSVALPGPLAPRGDRAALRRRLNALEAREAREAAFSKPKGSLRARFGMK
jgi:hypothetical protein